MPLREDGTSLELGLPSNSHVNGSHIHGPERINPNLLSCHADTVFNYLFVGIFRENVEAAVWAQTESTQQNIQLGNIH